MTDRTTTGEAAGETTAQPFRCGDSCGDGEQGVDPRDLKIDELRSQLRLPPEIAAIAEQLRTQDNRATAHPIFLVQQRRRVYGIDPAWGGACVWLHCDGDEAEEDKAAMLDSIDADDVPDEWKFTGYVDEWDFVTACLTEAGAQSYIDKNRHNLTDPRVYAASGYRNDEVIALRSFLLGRVPQ